MHTLTHTHASTHMHMHTHHGLYKTTVNFNMLVRHKIELD